MEAQIIETKQLRKDIDDIIQRVKTLRQGQVIEELAENHFSDAFDKPKCRELAITLIKLYEATMWLGMNLKRINEIQGGVDTNPYPDSKKPYELKYDHAKEGHDDEVVAEWELRGWTCVGKVWNYHNKEFDLTFQKGNTKIEPTADGLKL